MRSGWDDEDESHQPQLSGGREGERELNLDRNKSDGRSPSSSSSSSSQGASASRAGSGRWRQEEERERREREEALDDINDMLDRVWYDRDEGTGLSLGDYYDRDEEQRDWLRRREEKLQRLQAAHLKKTKNSQQNWRMQQRNADNEVWERDRLRRSGVGERTEVDLDAFLRQDSEDDTKEHVVCRNIRPPFLEGFHVSQDHTPLMVQDATSDMNVLAK